MKILLLQGPLGSFFQVLGNQLIQQQHTVYKIDFNGGDQSWPIKGHNQAFQGQRHDWQEYLHQHIALWSIDMIICFGDCRFYHRQAALLCQKLKLAFWVLEEGYIRPDFITLEAGGVNAYSPLYPIAQQLSEQALPEEVDSGSDNLIIGKTFIKRAYFASRYHIIRALKTKHFTHYINHRPWNLRQEAFSWLKGGIIKLLQKRPDHQLMALLRQTTADIFFVPLQVSEDFQIRQHSDLNSVIDMIHQVMSSFSQHAPKNALLVLKHHPMDRGFVNYKTHINLLIQKYQLQGRVHYAYELPLPPLYPLLTGVITINSTVGLSALHHNVPTCCLGRALYHLKGLTHQGSLNDFWTTQAPVSPDLYKNLHAALRQYSQINGSFFKQQESTVNMIIARMLATQSIAIHSPRSLLTKKTINV
ncbi:capsular biosynthesis protein [Shewanella surugensis]|uniref:Capsular biosynthesis protein n=1 Tax=Shewanella surugensis TaxID=212020 RepID=A0ABT0LF59_9GAMM|nr:capsular biosynthesis protein [Shewanella surugensis]MCL1126189.1 capsular biosynthesis protein [Shewanella surugensis]